MKTLYRLLIITIISVFSINSNLVNAQNNLPTQEEVDAKILRASGLSTGWSPKSTIGFLKSIEQDCDNAIPVCTTTYTETNSYTGSGATQEVNGTCLAAGETNSVWYTFTVQNTGTLAFLIGTANDYDFALYDITTIGCAGIPTAVPDRCNFSATGGATGLVLPTSATIPLSVGAGGAPTMPGLNVTAGNTYALIIDNWSADNNGYTLTFSGTSTIFDATPPSMTAVNSCTTNEIFLTIDENILCSSILQADYQLTNVTTSTNFTSAITSVTGVGCTGSLTNQIDLTHDGTLTSGSYEIEINAGPSLSDMCGNIIAVASIITFDYLAPITISPSVTNICNSGDAVTLTTNGGPAGETYTLTPGGTTNTTGVFVVNPVATTNYSVSITFGGCTQIASQLIVLEDNVIVSIDPVDPTICGGTATLTASTTINGVACPTCTYVWSTAETTTSISAAPGAYTVNATTPAGCASDNTASSTVSLASAGGGASCDVLYVSPAGGGDGLTKANPTTLAAAITAALCTNTIIKMQTGNYNFTDKVDVNSYVTIEGGYDATYTTKTSDMSSGNATTLIRSNAADSDDANDCTMFDVAASADAFRIQDIRIEMPTNHTLGSGISNYGIKLGSGAQNFNIVRCYIDAGTGADGTGGSTTVNFTTTGADTWTCPAGVTSATVTTWAGGGGGGGVNATSDGGGGGGGGGCSQSVLAVVPSTVYNLTVGAGGAGGVGQNDGAAGGQSWFNTAGTLQANGGNGGLKRTSTGGLGGAGAAAGIGTTTNTGGNGRRGRNHNTGRGGAGGGGAGTTTNGGGGATTTYGTAAGAGGATGGGNGGAGGTNANGNAGSTLGGGGSGAGDGTPQTGGNGARGQVDITYTGGGAAGDAYGVYGATDVQTNGGAITDCQIYAVAGANGGTACWLCDPADDGITGKNLTGQTIITMENFNCTTTDIDFVKPTSSTLGDPAPGGYCASTYSNTTDDWITNVTFNTINNNTGQEGAGSYGNYTAQSTNVNQGTIYNLSVTFSSGGFTQHVWAWFDWNQDGDFLDAGESYDLGQGVDATLNTNITIPGTATLGATRFRVTEEWNSDPVPCDAQSTIYGETEDYECQVYSGGSTDWSDLGINETATMPNANDNLTTQYTTGSFGRKDIDLVGAGTGNISMCAAQTWTSVDGRAIINNGCEVANSLIIPAQSCNWDPSDITLHIDLTGSGTCWAIRLTTPWGEELSLEWGNTPGWSNADCDFNDTGTPAGWTGGTNTTTFRPAGDFATWCTTTPNIGTFGGVNGGVPMNMGGTWQLRVTRGACAPGAATFNSWSLSVPAVVADDGTTYPTYTGFGNITMDQPSSGTVTGVTDVCPNTYNFASSEAGTPGYTYAWTVTDPAGGTSTVTSPTASSTDIDFTNTTAATINYTVSLVITSECCGPLTQVDYSVDVNPIPTATAVVNAAPTSCEGGSIDLQVSGPNATYTYSWYDAATGGTLLGTGTTYTVNPVPNGGANYYVEATTASGCTSTTRTLVALSELNTDPSVNNGTYCAAGLIEVSVNAVAGTVYNWYDASSGGTLLQSGVGLTYDVFVPGPAPNTVSVWVTATEPGCSESGRIQVDASITASPATTTWTGATSTNWFDPTNWSDCVPNCATDAVIPNVATDPIIKFSEGVAAVGDGIARTKRTTIQGGGSLSFGEDKSILEICENMEHDGILVMDDGGGTGRGKIIFISTTNAQLYRRTATGTGDFNVVEINNTWSTPTVTIENTGGYQDMIFRTDGQLILTNGRIITQTMNVDMRNTATTSVSGYSAASYVEGNLRRYVNNTGSYDFPVGHATQGYQNENISFASNSISYLTTRFDPWGGATPNPGAQGGGVECSATYNMTSLDNGFWTNTAGANPTLAVYDITLYNANYTNAATGWTVMKNSGAGWILDGTCVVSPLTAVLRLGQSGFSRHATAQSSSPLPVEIISFTGEALPHYNLLEWVTETEINNDFFTIERSADGFSFIAIGTVDGAGNSNAILNYNLIDNNPMNGVNYYRLKQTDFNGDYTYSERIALDHILTDETVVGNIYPNPASNIVFTEIHARYDEEISIEIIDMIGKIVISEKHTVVEGVNTINTNISHLAKGIYAIQITNKDNKVIEYSRIAKK